MESTKSNFKPWRADFKDAAFLCILAIVVFLIGTAILRRHLLDPESTNISLVMGITMLIVGIGFWTLGIDAGKKGYFRLHGARTEKTAVEQLTKHMPNGWHLKAGTMSAAGGDIDVIINTGSAVLAIEIKSPTSTWGCHSFFRRLFGFGIDPRADKAIEQAKRNAATISPNATPIVWLPLAKRFRGKRNDTLVVGGDARYFVKSLG